MFKSKLLINDRYTNEFGIEIFTKQRTTASCCLHLRGHECAIHVSLNVLQFRAFSER